MSSGTDWSAGRYESVAEHIAPIGLEVVAVADRRAPLRGAAVVDLACGTGTAALAAADRGAVVTGVDLTPELLALGEQKASAAGHSITWLAADASATGLPTQAFDAAVSNMGIIFVDPSAQVAEFERLLKPGATLAFSSWIRDPDNAFFRPIVEVLGPPGPAAFTPDQWGERDTIAERLSPGFRGIEIENGMHTWRFPSTDLAMAFMTRESPIHVSLFGALGTEQRDALIAAFEDTLRSHADGDGVRLVAPYVVVTALRR